MTGKPPTPTEYQTACLRWWWRRFHGQPPGDEVTPEQMAAKYLNPPAQWSRHLCSGEITEYERVPVKTETGETLMLEGTRKITHNEQGGD